MPDAPVRYAAPGVWLSARGVCLLLALCALLAVTAIVPALGIVFLSATAAIVALAIADLRLGPHRAQFQLRREDLHSVSVGTPARMAYEIVNPTASPLRCRIVEGSPPNVLFDDEAVGARVPARSSITVWRGFHAIDRGPAQFCDLYAQVENRVGLLQRRFVTQAPLALRVYPDLSEVEGYGILARRSTLLEAGLRKLRLRGAGSEFESLREYESGDTFRSIDWKASAHRGRLMVAQYDVERSQTIILAVDAGRLMTPRIGSRRKFDYALTASLCAARVAQIAGDNVGFVAFSAKPLVHIVPRRGVAHTSAMVRAAYDLEPRYEEPDYEALAADLKRRYAKRSLIIVFTDLFDPAASAAVLAALALLSPRHLVVCVLMNDAAIASALEREPRTPADAYRAAVALGLEDERRAAVATLRARGIIVVDAAAAKLTLALIDAYLDVKAKGLL